MVIFIGVVIISIVVFGVIAIFSAGSTMEDRDARRKNVQEKYLAEKQKDQEIINDFFASSMPNIVDTMFSWSWDDKFNDKLKFVIAFNNEYIGYLNNNAQLFLFAKGEIISCELRTKTTTITSSTGETTKKGVVDRAIVGAVIAGGVGAIVGGMTAKQQHNTITKTKNYSTYYLDIYTTHPSLPFFTLKESESTLRKWYAYALILINAENNTIPNDDTSNKFTSSADEIFKFKELLDLNIITKDEFEKEKRKLLNNNINTAIQCPQCQIIFEGISDDLIGEKVECECGETFIAEPIPKQ